MTTRYDLKKTPTKQTSASHTKGVTRRDALRKVTQTAAAGAIGMSGVATAASAFTDKNSATSLPAVNKHQWVSGHEGVLVFVDDWEGVSNRSMRAVTFLNTTDQPITLSTVNPGLLRAQDQVFNLNHVLARGAVTLEPQTPQSFGLYPVQVDNLEQLVSSSTDQSNTLVTCTPHSVSMDGWRQFTQYAVIV